MSYFTYILVGGHNMTMQKLLSKARKAIQDFDMIQENDKVAVGLSGGKDSLTLLHILKNYQRFSPNKFELIAITLNPGDLYSEELETDENGQITFTADLPVDGNYYVKELYAPDGFVTTNEEQDFTFEYAGAAGGFIDRYGYH